MYENKLEIDFLLKHGREITYSKTVSVSDGFMDTWVWLPTVFSERFEGTSSLRVWAPTGMRPTKSLLKKN